MTDPLRIGVGGPVGAGKTTLVEHLCRKLSREFEMAVVTNDIYTREDAQILWRSQALPESRIVGVETGGMPPYGNTRGCIDEPGRNRCAQRQVSIAGGSDC